MLSPPPQTSFSLDPDSSVEARARDLCMCWSFGPMPEKSHGNDTRSQSGCSNGIQGQGASRLTLRPSLSRTCECPAELWLGRHPWLLSRQACAGCRVEEARATGYAGSDLQTKGSQHACEWMGAIMAVCTGESIVDRAFPYSILTTTRASTITCDFTLLC